MSADSGFETIKVNVGSGNLFVRSKVAELAGPGVPAVGYQVYNSLHNPCSGDLWNPWFNDFTMTGLVVESGRVRYFDGTGLEWGFTQSGSTWVAPAGLNASLTRIADDKWRLTYDRTGEQLVFNPYGWAIHRQDRNGVGITYGWDDFGHLVSITDAVGKRVSVTRGPNNQIGTLSAAGRSTKFTYDSANARLLAVDAGGGRLASYTQSSSDHVRTITRDGRTLTFAYDSAGRVLNVTLARSGETSQVTSFAYAAGRTTMTDPRGNTVIYQLDSQGRVIKVTDQNGRERTQSWTSNSDVATTTDAFGTGGGPGNVTTATYDQLNNATGIVLPTGAATRALYAQGPDCQSAQSGHPYLPKCAIDDAGNRQSYTYDTAGNVTRVQDTTAGGTGAVFSYSYENAAGSVCGGRAGQVCSATDGNGHLTSYRYSSGNLTKVTPPAPLGATTYAYDAVSRVTAVTDGNGHTTRYAYDAADRITKTTFHNGQSLTAVYNPSGTVASETDAAGGRITYAYNVAGKQTRQVVQAPTGAGISGTVTMGYDASGNLTSYDDGTGTTRYVYDPANQLKQMTEPGGTCPASGHPAPNSGCVKFDYDRNGAEITRVLPGAARIDTIRDKSGRATRIHSRDAAGVIRVDIGYGYTSAGTDRTLLQTRTSTREEGIPSGAVTTYIYDSLQRLTSAAERDGSTTARARFTYVYDKAGNRTFQSQTGALGSARAGTVNYTYNAANQITATTADTGTWAYDKAGNETRHGSRGWTSTYGDRGQLTGMTSRTYTQFGQGNERTLRANTTNYLLSPLGVTRETVGGTTIRTTRTPDGQVVGSKRSASEYFVTDHLGSVVGIFSPTGTWTGGYSYTPYGERRFAGPGTSANNWRYIGSDEELASFYNLSARHYDATTGRFTQMDPTGQELNPYTYAQANPCNNTDPTGTATCAEAVTDLIGSIAGMAISIAPFVGLMAVTGGVSVAVAISARATLATLGVNVSTFFLAKAVGSVVNSC